MGAPTSSARFDAAPIRDEVWQRPALAQPAAIKIVADFAKEIGAAKFFDAGDVQANGFQIVEDDRTGDTFTETGASYMGFAASALLASAHGRQAALRHRLHGDGSFMMNPQILIDGVEHGVRGTIVIFDNRRMAAITGLQMAQYGAGLPHQRWRGGRLRAACRRRGGRQRAARRLDAPTSCERALKAAHAHDGLSVMHVPVYAGDARTRRPRRLGPVERRQLVRGRAARVDRAGSEPYPLRDRHLRVIAREGRRAASNATLQASALTLPLGIDSE